MFSIENEKKNMKEKYLAEVKWNKILWKYEKCVF